MRPNKRYHVRPAARRRRRINVGRFVVFILILAAIAFGIVLAVMFFTDSGPFSKKVMEPEPAMQAVATPDPYVTPAPPVDSADTAPSVTGTVPAAVDSTQPAVFGFSTDIEADGEVVSSYQRPVPISFPDASEYTQLKGVTTFRGDNYRDGGSYGAAIVSDEKLDDIWHIDTGELNGWSGSGWTGQPMLIQWDDDMRNMMDLYPEKKAKDGLVEVIYPTMDGKIYFLDIDDGSYTRDPIDLGFSVKGTASIDPRGYPLLYAGQGVGNSGTNENGDPAWDNCSMYIYSLIDSTLLYKYGAELQDEFSHRASWQAYDSSPLVAADADTLVWPGENGILYTFVLNSQFDRAAGTVSVSPSPGQPVKYRYGTPYNADDAEAIPGSRWWGMENSAAAWKNYLYFADNGGWMQCVDLNTMQLIWAQDVTDDTDCSTLLETDGDVPYLYTACEVDKQVMGDAEEGDAFIRKLNGLTGEIVWEVPYHCYYVNKIDGGALASPVLGRGDLEGMVFFTMSRVETESKGVIVALDKNTGEKIWEKEMAHYGWSSPVAVYTPEGKGYIIQCDSGGNMVLRDGKTGDQLDKVTLGINTNVEASPAVFNNIAIVGTRGERIYAVKIK